MVVRVSSEVQSSVSRRIFEIFVKGWERGTKVSPAGKNSGGIPLLGKGLFWLEEILSECSVVNIAEQFIIVD
jgi:hypothetical protein